MGYKSQPLHRDLLLRTCVHQTGQPLIKHLGKGGGVRGNEPGSQRTIMKAFTQEEPVKRLIFGEEMYCIFVSK
jgi:hypothetical protein